MVSFLKVLIRRSFSESQVIRLILGVFFIELISISNWYDGINHYSYTGLLFVYCAIVEFERDEVISFIQVLALIAFGMAMYEFFSGAYLFENLIERNGQSVQMNAKFVGGHSGVMRSKAFFYGPLDYGNFIIMASLFLRRNIRFLIILLISGFMASARLAMTINIAIIIIFNFREIFKTQFVLVLMSISMMSSLIFTDQIATSLTRFVSAFSMEDSGNLGRLFYWLSAIELFMEYDVLDVLVGTNGLYNSRFGNSTESGWLSLLVDNGIVGILIYILIFIRYLFGGFAREKIWIVSFLGVAMTTQTFHLGMSTNLLLGLFLLMPDSSSKIKKENEDFTYIQV